MDLHSEYAADIAGILSDNRTLKGAPLWLAVSAESEGRDTEIWLYELGRLTDGIR